MQLTIHKFKPSGKHYETFTISLFKDIHYEENYLERVSNVLLLQKRCDRIIEPKYRTVDDWFFITIVNDLPMVIWFK